MIVDTLLAHLSVSREDLLRFILLYARTEFALKRAGLGDGDSKRVTAKWNDFAEQLEPYYDSSRTVELRDAHAYFFQDPPRWQIWKNGHLDWSKPAVPNHSRGSLGKLLRMVSTVRNNLLHGGKFATALVRDPSRNAILLRHGSVLLEECVRLAKDHSPEVYYAFMEPLD